MRISKPKPVAPPTPNDIPALIGFASIIDKDFDAAFQVAHTHFLTNTAVVPTSNSGSFGDIVVVDQGTGKKYLYVRCTDGWHYVMLT